jgi:hypothetical protein
MAFCENGRQCATMSRASSPGTCFNERIASAGHQMKTAALIGTDAPHMTCRTDVAGSGEPYTGQSDFGSFR